MLQKYNFLTIDNVQPTCSRTKNHATHSEPLAPQQNGLQQSWNSCETQAETAKPPVTCMGFRSWSSWTTYAIKPKFHLARHVSTRHDWTRSTCQAHAFLPASSLSNSTARHDQLDMQLSSLCNLYKLMICKLFTNLLEYTVHLFNFISSDGTNKICVYVRA